MPVKKKKHVNYSAKTLKFFREKLGLMIDRVEQPYNPFSGKRKDFLGIIDYIAISDTKTIGVQSTSMNGDWEHRRTISQHPNTVLWLQDPNRELLLVSWATVIAQNRKLPTYKPKITRFHLDGLEVVETVFSY